MLIQDALDQVAEKVSATTGRDTWTDPAKEPVVDGIEVADTGIMYHDTMSRAGYHVLEFTVTAFLAKSDTVTGVADARRFLSPSGSDSLKTAAEAASAGDLQAVTAVDGNLALVERSGGRYVVARVTFTSRIKES